MTYQLIIGDYAYSSWSLRGWLLFEKFGIKRQLHQVSFSGAGVLEQLTDFAPSRTVPTAKTPEGAILSDSLAMAEELATRHPEAQMWPADAFARATARSLAAEMHSSFSALRNECPMSLRQAYVWDNPSADVRKDLERLEEIWSYARAACAPSGPWLCGDYSIADVFFAPIAGRLAGYSLPVGAEAAAYVNAHLADPAFRQWRAMGMVHGKTLPWYAQPHSTQDWPGPAPRKAVACTQQDSVNDACPYSGKPVTHFMEMNGVVYGFCNKFCRDKTVADPEAWPAFMALVAND